jgi:glycine/serine hydroxymethyltransferase
MRQIGQWIADVLGAPGDEGRRTAVRAAVREMCSAFPLYRELAELA